MGEQGFAILILAAGKATRFKSEHSKMLHSLAGRPLGDYVLRAALAARPEQILMVVGHEAPEVMTTLDRPGVTFIEQKDQLGTGHAVSVARGEIERLSSPTLAVVVGDAPLLRADTLRALVNAHAEEGAAATVLTTEVANPQGYGRVVRAAGTKVRAIVEERICTPAQRKIREINSGIICFAREQLLKHLDSLSSDNAQKEFLLTDLVEIFNRHHLKVAAFQVEDAREVLGVNDRVELAQMEKIFRLRKAESLMRDGVTIVDPESTYIDEDVTVGNDTIIEPGVSLQGATRVGRSCTIRSGSTIMDSVLGYRVTVRQNCVIASSEIASDAVIGPFAHLRDGAALEPDARIGNFVEVKKSRVGRGSKALHLTYLGDSTIGDRVNVGAGTVTCNYDGEKKNPTFIETGVFVGSGAMLVAPLRVGRNSYIAAGSTITDDVPPDSLAIGRARQTVKEGWTRQRDQLKPSVTILVREAGAVTVLDVGGRLTLGEPVAQLNRALRSAFDSGVRNLLINLTKLVYIDSAGMGVLVSALKTSQAEGKRLKLSAIPQKVRVLLETANLDRVFEIHPDEAAALVSFGEGPPA